MASVSRTRSRAGRPRLKPTLRRGPSMDFATLLGVSGGFAVIGLAMYLGGSAGSFVNLPGILIVLCGTLLVTSISFTLEEVARTQRVMLRAAVYRVQDPAQAVLEVMDLAEQARRKGVLDLQTKLPRLSHNDFLQRAMGLVVDGLPGDELDRTLTSEAAETMHRHLRSASVLRRAAEVAPAMGLIGTLVGLVQMLGRLQDPSTIGPAMAVALLTTFYGAVLAHMVFNPLAGKLERNAQVENMVNQIYATGAASVSRQENPRRLEIKLNALLPPQRRVDYFT